MRDTLSLPHGTASCRREPNDQESGGFWVTGKSYPITPSVCWTENCHLTFRVQRMRGDSVPEGAEFAVGEADSHRSATWQPLSSQNRA